MTDGCRISSCFSTRLWPIFAIHFSLRSTCLAGLTLNLRALIVPSWSLWSTKLGPAHILLGYSPALVGGCALLAVGVDATFGEVVGAAAGEDEDAPAVGYGGFLGGEC